MDFTLHQDLHGPIVPLDSRPVLPQEREETHSISLQPTAQVRDGIFIVKPRIWNLEFWSKSNNSQSAVVHFDRKEFKLSMEWNRFRVQYLTLIYTFSPDGPRDRALLRSESSLKFGILILETLSKLDAQIQQPNSFEAKISTYH